MAEKTRVEPPHGAKKLATTPARSALMARVRSVGNRSTELRVVRLLRKSGITGWRRHYPIIGKPDFVFLAQRFAIFIDGCFWHGCPKCYKPPRTNRLFWAQKLAYNRDRDSRTVRDLRHRGWSVLRIWEHSLQNEAATLRRIRLGHRLAKEAHAEARGDL